MYTIMPYARYNTFTRPVNDFIRSFFDVTDLRGPTSFPVDVREVDNAYLLAAELPGIPKDKLILSVEEDTLTIGADLNQEKTESQEGYLYSERRTGHVERHFNMEGIDTGAISAAYENGVLSVTLPKQKQEDKPEARNIEIE